MGRATGLKDRFQDVLGGRRGTGEKVGQAPVTSVGLVCPPEGEIPANLERTLKAKTFYQGGQRRQILDSGVRIFDQQTSAIRTGHVIGGTIYGTTIRTDTTGRDYDLATFERMVTMPPHMKEFCLKALQYSPINVYALFHYRNNTGRAEDMVIHSVIVTDSKHRFLRQFTSDKKKSRDIVHACAPYLAIHP